MPASASPPPSPPVRTPGQQPSHPASATNRSRTPQNDRFALYSPRNPDRRWIRAKPGLDEGVRLLRVFRGHGGTIAEPSVLRPLRFAHPVHEAYPLLLLRREQEHLTVLAAQDVVRVKTAGLLPAGGRLSRRATRQGAAAVGGDEWPLREVDDPSAPAGAGDERHHGRERGTQPGQQLDLYGWRHQRLAAGFPGERAGAALGAGVDVVSGVVGVLSHQTERRDAGQHQIGVARVQLLHVQPEPIAAAERSVEDDDVALRQQRVEHTLSRGGGTVECDA